MDNTVVKNQAIISIQNVRYFEKGQTLVEKDGRAFIVNQAGDVIHSD